MTPQDAAELVNGYLRAECEHRVTNCIRKSELPVIDRLIKAGSGAGANAPLPQAWRELLELHPRGVQRLGMTCDRWQMVIDQIVSTAAYCHPERIAVLREAIKDINALTREIVDKARDLANKLRERSREMERLGVTPLPGTDPLDLMEPAAKVASLYDGTGDTHGLYVGFVKPRLHDLRARFDGKYWPTMADLLEALADVQTDVKAVPDDSLSRAATEVRQRSNRDFLRALDQAIGELAYYNGVTISFSDQALAAVANAALGLDETFSPGSVAQYRREMNGRRK